MNEHPERDEERVQEQDPHERAPEGEDEATAPAQDDPAGKERTDDDLPPGLGRLEH